jgi:hypothetical protein
MAIPARSSARYPVHPAPLGRLSRKRSTRYLVFSKVGPNQSIERGQIRVSKSNVDKPPWLFPKLLVCLDCGSSRFSVPEKELALLASGALKS